MTPEQKQKRMAELEWSCMTPTDHAERIVNLEELVTYIYQNFRGVVLDGWSYTSEDFDECERRMRELGVEVD